MSNHIISLTLTDRFEQKLARRTRQINHVIGFSSAIQHPTSNRCKSCTDLSSRDHLLCRTWGTLMIQQNCLSGRGKENTPSLSSITVVGQGNLNHHRPKGNCGANVYHCISSDIRGIGNTLPEAGIKTNKNWLQRTTNHYLLEVSMISSRDYQAPRKECPHMSNNSLLTIEL